MKTATLLPLAALLLAGSALAGDHRYPLSSAYVAECGSCHVAYPPELLTPPAWTATMQGLAKHFGSDASLDARSHKEIDAWLQSRASNREKHANAGKEPRMSETVWFRKEHRNLSLPAKDSSFAQCNACHTLAEKGDYGKSSLIPAMRSERHKEERGFWR